MRAYYTQNSVVPPGLPKVTGAALESAHPSNSPVAFTRIAHHSFSSCLKPPGHSISVAFGSRHFEIRVLSVIGMLRQQSLGNAPRRVFTIQLLPRSVDLPAHLGEAGK